MRRARHSTRENPCQKRARRPIANSPMVCQINGKPLKCEDATGEFQRNSPAATHSHRRPQPTRAVFQALASLAAEQAVTQENHTLSAGGASETGSSQAPKPVQPGESGAARPKLEARNPRIDETPTADGAAARPGTPRIEIVGSQGRARRKS